MDLRAACLVWAGLNVLLAAPLNWLTIPRHGNPAPLAHGEAELPFTRAPRAAMPILAFFFSATWFVQGAMAAHLPGLLQAAGASSTAAIAAAALVGPAQVGARLVEFGVFARSTRFFGPAPSVLHPIGAAFIALFGVPGIVVFALLHGAGNGMITIVKGTLPLALFGPEGYGRRSGLLSAPARTLQSAAPFVFGLLLDRVGIEALGLSAGLCLAAFGSLFLLRPHRAGKGLPPGAGTPAQGAHIYAEKCAAYHGPEGKAGIHGGHGGAIAAVGRRRPDHRSRRRRSGSPICWPYPTTVFDYIRRSMPGSSR